MKIKIIAAIFLGIILSIPSASANTQSLVFNGTGEWVNYEVKVSGEIQEKKGITGEDDVYVGGANGAVSSGADRYSFTGNITELNLSNSEAVVVTINGKAVDYSSYKEAKEESHSGKPDSENKTAQNSTNSASKNSTDDGGESYDETVDNYSDGSEDDSSFPLLEVIVGAVVLGILMVAGIVLDEMGKQYKCNNCGHQWRTRNSGGEPPYCPKCRSKDIEKIL